MAQIAKTVVLLFVFVPNLYAKSPNQNISFPSYNTAVEKHCETNPFDCMKSGTLSGYALDTLLKSFYQQSEQIAVDAGFELASFEYCSYTPNSCNVDVNKITDKKIYRLHKQVKGSPFQITPIYPKKDSWWRASNGERYQSSSKVIFYKEVPSGKIDRICTIEQIPGNKLQGNLVRAIRKDPMISFPELMSRAKGSRVFLRVKAPSLLSKEYVSEFGLVFECLLTSRAGLSDRKKTTFRSRLTTEEDFHFALNEVQI